MSVQYEWDETKRLANLKRHGLDFFDAHLVYEHPEKLTVDSPRGGEDRKMDIAQIDDGITLTLIYTERQARVRVVSFRIASRKERRQYHAWQGLG